MTLEEYIPHWRLEVWETCFFRKFKPIVVFIVTKLQNNNMEKRGPLKEFFIGENSNFDLCI
jgi:hypothetical protein